MKTFRANQESNGRKTLSVFALYDDPAARETVLAVAQRLAGQFRADIKFEFHWWRTSFLADPGLGSSAAAQAADADIMVVAGSQTGDFSFALLNWFETWIELRHQPEGALLDLTQTGTTSPAVARQTGIYFQEIAQRAKMDYLRGNATTTGSGLRRLKSLATAVLPPAVFLNRATYQAPPPTHFGLNE